MSRGALFDSGGAGEQPPHRAHQPARHRGRDSQAEQSGDRQQRQADCDGALLIGTGGADRAARQLPHLAARRVDAAVEIVAHLVERRQQPSGVGAVAGLCGRQ